MKLVSDSSLCSTTCPYCGVGCGVQVSGSELNFTVAGDASHPANAGRLCVKGTALAETLGDEGRLLSPVLNGREVSWDKALDDLVARLSNTLVARGSDAVALYLSGQLLTEDYYVANKLMKGFLGSANVDTNSRLCMASAVAGYKRAFGEDVVPCNYDDLELCDLLLFIGSNAAWTHPVLYQRAIASRRQNPNKQFVVIDTRRTATCDEADLFLQIKPGSDGYLFGGLLKFLVDAGAADKRYLQAHVEGQTEALMAVSGLSVAVVAQFTGLPEEILQRFYRLFQANERVVSFYSQGINQSATGTDKCNAIINCHLVTGRIGRPGCGPFSITGQPNAMGGREVGGLANQLAAHMDFDAESIDRVQRFWQAPAMAKTPGYKAVDMFQRAADGEIDFLWIMATNPAVSLPASATVRRALERCEYLVVSDCTTATETARYADLLLPAMPWGEKDGTVTNSERMISRQRAFRSPRGAARADWEVVTDVAARLGFSSAFPYRKPADIFREHSALSGYENEGGRIFNISDFAEITDQQYDELRPTRWPTRLSDDRPFSAGEFPTPSGKARMVAVRPELPQLAADPDEQADLPRLTLNTGRFRDQWHTMTRTGLVPRLSQHRDFLRACFNPSDAEQLGLIPGELVTLDNTEGKWTGLVEIDGGIAPGACFAPIHWSAPFSGAGKVSDLIASVTDPVSGQPESKIATVRPRALSTQAWAHVISESPFAHAPPNFSYWSTIAIDGGWLTLVSTMSSPEKLHADLLAHFTAEPVASYTDGSANLYFSTADFEGSTAAIYVAPRRNDLPSKTAISQFFNTDHSNPLRALNPGADAYEDNGPLICSCHDVGANSIISAIKSGVNSVSDLGIALRCGTECGSCIPELKQLLKTGSK